MIWNDVLIKLLQSMGVLLALVLIVSYLRPLLSKLPVHVRAMITGLLFGGAGVIGMMDPVVVGEGVILDARTVVVALAAIHWGLIGGVAAAVPVCGYRIILGGSGTVAGVGAIVGTLLMSVIARRWLDERKLKPSIPFLLIFGVLYALQTVCWVFTMPRENWHLINQIAPGVMIVFPMSFIFMGHLLNWENERHEALQDIQSSEERLKALLNQLPLLVDAYDKDGRLVFWNHECERVTGYQGRELLGRDDILDVMYPDPEYRAWIHVDYKKHGHIPQGCEWKLTSKNGDERSVAWSNVAGDPPLSEWNHWAAGVDVTERARAQDSLEANLAQFRALFDLSPMGILLEDVDGTILDVNPAQCDILGRTREELVGSKVHAISHPDEIPRVEEHIDRILEGETLTHLVKNLLPDGRLRYLVLMETRIPMVGGKMGIMVVCQDITEHHLAEQMIQREHRFSRVVIDNAAEGLCVGHSVESDQGIQFTVWNHRMVEITGYTKDEVNEGGIHFKMFPDPEVCQRYLERVQRVMSGEPMVSEEWEITHRDGSVRTVLFSTTVLEVSDDRPQVLGMVHDITERRLMAERMQEAQKLESLGVLAGGIAHDFNNLLTGILGNASLAQLEIEEGSPLSELMEQIELAAERAADLARQMLAYSGRGRFVIMPLDLNGLIEEMEKLLTTSVSKKAEVKLEFDRSIPPIEGDATQLRQVVMNLITNASEALGDGVGEIKISTELTEVNHHIVRGPFIGDPPKLGSHVLLRVSDNGCGVQTDDVSKIFEPFYTTKFTGRGLGLAAVLGIIRGHRGAISVKSRRGEGTVVDVYLPLVSAEVAEVESKTPAPPSLPDGTSLPIMEGTCHVLVVDDEPSVRHLATRILKSKGCSVSTANDGVDALEILRGSDGQIDVVLLDLTMPRMDGQETLEAMRKQGINVPVVLSSGFTEQEARTKFSQLGIACFLHKPYRQADLIAALRRATEKPE